MEMKKRVMSSEFTAKGFLKLVEQALGNIDVLEKAISWDSKYGTPDLVPSTRGWQVDEDQFARFESLVDFLRLTLFGTDEDGRYRDAAVRVRCVDRSREQSVLPHCRVPRLRGRDEFSIRAIHKALESARINASGNNSLVERLERTLQSRLRDQWDAEDRVARAKGCPSCGEKGYVKVTLDEWFNMDLTERRWRRRGCSLPSYCLLCEDCQGTNE